MTPASRTVTLTGAVLVLIGGAVHLELLVDRYGTGDIAVAFVVNAGVSALVAGYLVVRRDRLGPVIGIGLAVASLVALALSHTSKGVLGFMEHGLDPMPQLLIAVVAEGASIVMLAWALRRGTTDARMVTRVLAQAETRSGGRRDRPFVASGRDRGGPTAA